MMNAAAQSAPEMEFFSPKALAGNQKRVNFMRTAIALTGGIACGILGFTGLYGFLFFIALAALNAVILASTMKFNVSDYLPTSTRSFILSSLLSNLLTYLLFWTLSYALVHLYE